MIELATADPETVRALMGRLVSAFEEFATEAVNRDPDGLRHAEALMGFHNAYKVLLLDLERRFEEAGRPDRHNIIRRTAVDTLIAGLGLQSYYPPRG